MSCQAEISVSKSVPKYPHLSRHCGPPLILKHYHPFKHDQIYLDLSLCRVLFNMCELYIWSVKYRDCTHTPKHVETMSNIDPCDDVVDGIRAQCENPTERGGPFGSTSVRGQCPVCLRMSTAIIIEDELKFDAEEAHEQSNAD
jgi:hypothetical protein